MPDYGWRSVTCPSCKAIYQTKGSPPCPSCGHDPRQTGEEPTPNELKLETPQEVPVKKTTTRRRNAKSK